jgi:hypothetical protein
MSREVCIPIRSNCSHLQCHENGESMKLSQSLTDQALRHEDVWPSGCTDAPCLDFDTRWRRVVSCTSVWTTSTLTGLELLPSGCPARSQSRYPPPGLHKNSRAPNNCLYWGHVPIECTTQAKSRLASYVTRMAPGSPSHTATSPKMMSDHEIQVHIRRKSVLLPSCVWIRGTATLRFTLSWILFYLISCV